MSRVISRLSEDFEFACLYSSCIPGAFSNEKSVEIKCYDSENNLSLDYVAIHKDHVDESAGLVGISRLRELSDKYALVDIHDGNGNSSFKIPLKSLRFLNP